MYNSSQSAGMGGEPKAVRGRKLGFRGFFRHGRRIVAASPSPLVTIEGSGGNDSLDTCLVWLLP